MNNDLICVDIYFVKGNRSNGYKLDEKIQLAKTMRYKNIEMLQNVMQAASWGVKLKYKTGAIFAIKNDTNEIIKHTEL